MSSWVWASVNNWPTIYNQNQEPNPTENITLLHDSKRLLMVLALHVLLSNKKRLEIVSMPRMEKGIRH